jgi:endoglucanase
MKTRRNLMTKTILTSLVCVLYSCAPVELQISDIRLNQLGFYPNSEKRVMIVDRNDIDTVAVIAVNGESILKTKLDYAGFYEKSGEKVYSVDISVLKDPGTYFILLPDSTKSYPFEIKEALYSDVLNAAVKSYYYQRLSIPLEEKHAGKWHRPEGHPDTLCYFHESTGRSEGTISSPKGWLDAGDYNKYVVNSSFTMSFIYGLYQLYPELISDGQLNIPESGDGLSDLLGEMRYNLDWMLTMQDTDGGVFHKLTSKSFGGFIMPHKDNDDRYVVGKSTEASLGFTATTAIAARIYKVIDPEFSEKCLLMSEKAWTWAVANPQNYFSNPEDIHTGNYGDDDSSEEFLWAAAELFITTSAKKYETYIIENLPELDFRFSENWRLYQKNMAFHSLAVLENSLPKEITENIRNQIIVLADELYTANAKTPYRVDLEEFHWGSNSDIADIGVIYCYAHKLTGDNKYLNAAVDCVDYLLGRNATGYSFVTGFGSKTPMNLHHRPSGADGIAEPMPGFLVGGPNQFRQDDLSATVWGVEYPSTLPAKSYVDLQGSFASNEICLNWNAPFVFLLGYLETNMNSMR